MHRTTFIPRWALACTAALLLSACGGGNNAPAPEATPSEGPSNKTQATHPSVKYPDHHEFEASLNVPFAAPGAAARTGARSFTIDLDYVGAPKGQLMAYRLELFTPKGQLLQRSSGVLRYEGQPVVATVPFAGRPGLPSGVYEARLLAVTADPDQAAKAGTLDQQFDELLAAEHHGHPPIEQRWPFVVGEMPRAKLPAFRALPVAAQANSEEGRKHALSAPATGSWPYTVYYANLHSQTNDSDGGGAIGNCTSSQPAQTGEFGPADAFAYGKAAGLDVLMTSEHNHYFDGSSSTNASGSAAAAKARYQNGLRAASDFNAANPGLLAVYGMEWGVISNGGHMNIYNSPELLAWESNSAGELFGDRFTAKSDYAALYATMRANGYIGQFNHPESSGQFLVGGTALGYSADGDEVMVAAEILNTSAFSSNTTESETGRSSYESTFKKLLERGFHVAPVSNQDNHCANWGKAYTNRTGVLVPAGTAISQASFIEAMKARRVFASMDKNSQLIFSANGKLMGQRFDNSGVLNFNVGFANSAGRSAATVEILEGVPGRNGTVTTLASSGTASTTPAVGPHFYYAKVTQDDGKVLWSAPVWVNQTSGGGGGGGAATTPPTATASVSGNQGSITLAATASDNIGVTRLEFSIDGVLKATDTSAPYSTAFDSRTLANGSHTLVARAFDAAGNSGASSAVAFTISNPSSTLAETESNGNVDIANVITTQTTITGTMGNTTDKDFFKLALAPNQKLRVDMTCPASLDYDLYLMASSTNTLTSSESATCTESLSYTNGSSARTVYIRVQSYSGSSTTQGYRLTLSYP